MRHVESDYSVVSMGVMVGAVVVQQLRKVQLPTHNINITITYLGSCGPMTYSLLFITSLLFQIQAI